MEMMRISSMEQLEGYRNAWSSILEEKNNTNPFIEFEWITKWIEHFGDDVNLEIVVVLVDGEPIAFAPFSYEVKRLGYVYNFIGFGQANYMDFIVPEVMTKRVIAFVFDEIIKLRKRVLFNLHGVLKSSKTATHIAAYLKINGISIRTYPVETPYIAIEGLNLDEYLESRKKLHGLDRREKRLRSLGEVELLPGCAEEMAYMFDLHNQRWGHRNDTSGFTDEKRRSFYQQLALVSSGAMNVKIEALYLEKKMIAFTYGLNCRGRYMGYVLGHDQNFDYFSPGRILVKEKIKESVQSPVKFLDMSIGHEPYKTEWKTDQDYTKRIVFSTNTFRTKIMRNILLGKLEIAANVKKHRKFVLFKRNTIGNVKFVLKNMWTTKGLKKIKPLLFEKLKKTRMFIYDSQSYFIYRKERNDEKQSTTSYRFTELTIKKVFKELDSKEVDMKEVSKNLYGNSRGYYSQDQHSYKNLFWVNQNVIRIDNISYIEQLKKKSVYIDKWNASNLEDVCTFVHQNNKPRTIFACVSSNVKKDINALEKFGFKVNKKVSKRTYLGFNKSIVKDY